MSESVSWGSIPEGFTATSCKVCGVGKLNPAYAQAAQINTNFSYEGSGRAATTPSSSKGLSI